MSYESAERPASASLPETSSQPRIRERLQRFLAGLHNLSPAQWVIIGYLIYMVVGWMLLSLPFAQKSIGVGALDNLFIVAVDIWRVIRGKTQQITLTSKIILWATLWLAVGGTLLLFLTEPSIQRMPIHERLMAAFPSSVSGLHAPAWGSICSRW